MMPKMPDGSFAKKLLLPVPDLSAYGQVQVCPQDERGQPRFLLPNWYTLLTVDR